MTLDFKKLLKNALMKQMSIQHVDIKESNVQIFGREELASCGKVVSRLKELYGENFLLDADYWLFFSGTNLTKEMMDKQLFKVVNSAFQNSANDMKDQEMRMFTFDSDDVMNVDKPETAIDDVNIVNTPDTDGQNGRAISDVLASDDDSIDEIKDAVDAELDSDELDSDEGETPDSAEEKEPADEPEADGDDSEIVADTGDAESAAGDSEDADEEIQGPADGQAEDDDSAEDEDDDEVEIDESVVYPDEGEKFVFLKITMK